jgi:hypothetical protein
MRIIGVELRLQYLHPKRGNQQNEIIILPCNAVIVLPDECSQINQFGSINVNGTMHTDCGDFGFRIDNQFAYDQFDQKTQDQKLHVSIDHAK